MICPFKILLRSFLAGFKLCSWQFTALFVATALTTVCVHASSVNMWITLLIIIIIILGMRKTFDRRILYGQMDDGGQS